MPQSVERVLQAIFIVAGASYLIFAAGYFFNQPWATATWPWSDGPLSMKWYASIFATFGVQLVWLGISREWRGVAPVCASSTVIFLGSAWTTYEYAQGTDDPQALGYVAGYVALALLGLVGVFFFRRFPARDQTVCPRSVDILNLVMVVGLVAVGIPLLLRARTIFPWPLQPQTSGVIGWLFLGTSVFYLYAYWCREWQVSRTLYLGMFAYDVVLIPPFLQHFETVHPDHLPSLSVFLTVLIIQLVGSIIFLFLHPVTRGFRFSPAPSASGQWPVAGLP